MLAVCVTATPSTVADMVFDSATVELCVPVATPLAFVVALGCVSVLPVHVAERTTVAPAIGFPNASRAVTVTVDWLLPLEAVIGDVADTLDCAPETVLAWTTTVAVWVIATVLMVADTVFDSATIELSVPVATPLAFVVPLGCVSVLLAPVAIGDVAVTVDWPADKPAGFTTTVAVCVTATVLIVAEIVLDSATVDRSLPVATPLALVVPLGCVRVLPVPVAASTTVAPAIGFPDASRAVTVMMDWLLGFDEAAIGEVAATLDCAPETGPTSTTTVAVCVTATLLMV